MNISKCLFVFLLVASCAAQAQPVRVTSQTSGNMTDLHHVVLENLGYGELIGHTGGPVPFELTISAFIDPESRSTFVEDDNVQAYATETTVTLTLGGRTSHFSDASAIVMLGTSSSRYHTEVIFDHGDSPIWISTWLNGDANSFVGMALASQEIHQQAGMISGVEIITYPSNPDAPGLWSMATLGDNARLSVVSAVPEPASAVLLLTGMLILAGLKGGTRLRLCKGDAVALP